MQMQQMSYRPNKLQQLGQKSKIISYFTLCTVFICCLLGRDVGVPEFGGPRHVPTVPASGKTVPIPAGNQTFPPWQVTALKGLSRPLLSSVN
jgi:hypothetical protein